MAGVERFDVGADVGGPVVDGGGGAAVAAGFVAKFPGEDGRRGFVPLDDEFDVVFVCPLGFLVRVEGGGVASESGGVAAYAAEVVPVVQEW